MLLTVRYERDYNNDFWDGTRLVFGDDGEFHLNSGIANRAFHLAAMAIGGRSWLGAGPTWFDALTRGDMGPHTDFTGFAAATIAVAGVHAEVVEQAWRTVGMLSPHATPREEGAPPSANVVSCAAPAGCSDAPCPAPPRYGSRSRDSPSPCVCSCASSSTTTDGRRASVLHIPPRKRTT